MGLSKGISPHARRARHAELNSELIPIGRNHEKEEATPTLLFLATVVVVFLIIAAMQPSGFRVEPSAKLAAPASVMFPQVNDLHKLQDRSP